MSPIDRARRSFHAYMERAKQRPLTEAEKKQLAKARQLLRRARRPAMNRKPTVDFSSHATRPTGRRTAGTRGGRSLIKRNKRGASSGAGLVRMGRLIELRYDRDHGAHPGLYKHVFKTKPTVYYNPRTNQIIVKGGR